MLGDVDFSKVVDNAGLLKAQGCGRLSSFAVGVDVQEQHCSYTGKVETDVQTK